MATLVCLHWMDASIYVDFHLSYFYNHVQYAVGKSKVYRLADCLSALIRRVCCTYTTS